MKPEFKKNIFVLFGTILHQGTFDGDPKTGTGPFKTGCMVTLVIDRENKGFKKCLSNAATPSSPTNLSNVN